MLSSDTHIIFHVDVNSAYLSWSALKCLQDDPGSVDLRTIPSAVGGDVKTRHGIITAKSIPAKKYGIVTGEPVVKALQKCPQLVMVPSDFDTYHKYSHALMDLLWEYTPTIQQMSIDEAFLDVTAAVKTRLHSFSDQSQKAAVRNTAAMLSDEVRRAVFEQLGFTVNVGISENKLLAKMASDFKKPDMTHTLFPDEIPQKMWPLPIGKLFGCGKATSDKLQSVGIHTIGDAAKANPAFLQSLLGEKAGGYIHDSANGISSSHVVTEREQAKSISNETTLPEDLASLERVYPIIKKLSQKVAARMQKSALLGQTVTLQVKTADFQRHSRQMSLPSLTDKAADIESAAVSLAERFLPELFLAGGSIRLIGVGVSKLSDGENRQMDLTSWAEEKQEIDLYKQQKQKQEALDQVVEELDARFGAGTITKGIKS